MSSSRRWARVSPCTEIHILSTISIQQLTMLLRFQCSKSTDNPKIYVSSAARHLKDIGLPLLYSPHSFRVTGITDLREQGVALEDVQRLAGHADPRTTTL
jgi:integrase